MQYRWYVVAKPSEYLAIAGIGIKSTKITKSGWVWPPFQKCQRFSIQPQDYNLPLQVMTRENLQFLLRVAFNVGPRTSPENDEVSPHLKKYVMLLPNAKNTNGSHVQKIVKDVIEGRARVLVSSMTMEQIRADLNSFMKVLSNNIQAELDQYGLKIHNAEAKELGDSPETDYFARLSEKSHEHIRNKAATSRFNSQGQQYVENARIQDEAAARSLRYQRRTKRSLMESLKLKEAYSITELETRLAVEKRVEELQKELERARAEREFEHQRVTHISKAKMEADSVKVAIDTELYRQVSAEISKTFKVRLQALNRVYTERIKNVNFRNGNESLGSSPWSILSVQEIVDSILAELMNLAENGGNTATGAQGGTVLGPLIQDSDSAIDINE